MRYRRRTPAIDPHVTPVRRRPRLDFSVTGLIYCTMMMFMGLAAVNSQANLLFGIFGLMIGTLIVTYFIGRVVLGRLTITRLLPESAVVGTPIDVGYEFSNGKRFWPSLSVTLAELQGVEAFVRQPHGYLLHAACRQTAVIPIELIPKRRGLHQLGRYQLSTSFPFGFIKRATDRSRADTLLVYPAIGQVNPRLIAMARSADSSGPTVRPRPGGADEFYGVKEFRTGENPRNIYWKRSARTGTLVAKEMTHVSPPRLVILLDTYSPIDNAGDRNARVERAIAMAASLISQGLETNLAVGISTRGGDDWLGVAAARGKRHRRDLLSLLAQLPRNTTHPMKALIDASRDMQRNATTSVIISGGPVELGLTDRVRGGTVALSAGTPQADAWFTFSPIVDFARCSPTALTQLEPREKPRAHRFTSVNGLAEATPPVMSS